MLSIRLMATLLLILLLACSSYMLYSFIFAFTSVGSDSPIIQLVVVAIFILAIQLSKIVGTYHFKSLLGVSLTLLSFGFCIYINVTLSNTTAVTKVDLSYYDNQLTQIDTIIKSAQRTTWRGSLTQSAANIIEDANHQREILISQRGTSQVNQLSTHSHTISSLGGFIELMEFLTLMILMFLSHQKKEIETSIYSPSLNPKVPPRRSYPPPAPRPPQVSKRPSDEIKKAKRKLSQLKYRLNNNQIKPETYEKRFAELSKYIAENQSR